jgi:2-keto-4-pentenoate hydratase
MLHRDGATVDAGRLIAPRAEAEIAFRLRTSIAGPDVGVEDVLAATDAVAPALEVIDSRIADWRITITDTIADNASSAHAVVGEFRPVGSLDLPAVAMRMDVDGTSVEGRGAAVLGHPATAVAWLARALHAQGEALEAGEIVLAGALARALPVARGSRARADLDGLGSVHAGF